MAVPIGGVTDPWNLHRVIPAKGVREIVDAPRGVALVFAGGDPVDADIAARLPDADVTVVEKRMQGRDHPVLMTVPETYYLKCFILRKLA